MYINPRGRTTAQMSTHPLPYQLVSQNDTLQQGHIAQMLGRTTQVNFCLTFVYFYLEILFTVSNAYWVTFTHVCWNYRKQSICVPR